MAREQEQEGLEAERAVLGAVLADNSLIVEIAEVVSAEDFRAARHSAIFQAMLRLDSAARAVDHLTLAEELKAQGQLSMVGGPAYLMALDQAVPFASNVLQYARLVREQASRRRLAAAAQEILEAARSDEGEVAALHELAEQRIFALGERRTQSELRPMGEFLEPVLDQLDRMKQCGSGITGLASGFIDLDEQLTGFHPGELIILAARPGMGKTSFAMNVATHVGLKEGRAVGIFSLEMPGDQLTMRMLASHARVDMKKLRGGRLTLGDEERFQEVAGQIYSAPLFLDDSGGLSVFDLRAKARRLKLRQPSLALIIIDYLQLMQSKGKVESRQLEVSEISRGLKQLSKDLAVPIIALSQLSRKVEERKKGPPMLSDLRESGSLEQDADVVLFIHREEPEKGKEEPEYPRGADDPVEVDLVVAKQRNGPIGSVPLLFFPAFTRFESKAKGW